MKTFMRIGEYLANPFVAGVIITVFIIPVFYGLFKILEWLRIIDYRKE